MKHDGGDEIAHLDKALLCYEHDPGSSLAPTALKTALVGAVVFLCLHLKNKQANIGSEAQEDETLTLRVQCWALKHGVPATRTMPWFSLSHTHT